MITEKDVVVDILSTIWFECNEKFKHSNWPSMQFKYAISNLNVSEEQYEIDDAVNSLTCVASEFSKSPNNDIAAYAKKIFDVIASLRH